MEIKSIAESIMKSLPELTECESYLIGNIKILGNNGDAVLKGGSTIIVRLPDIFGTTRFKSEENKIILKMRNEKSPEVIAKEFDSLKSLADKDDPNAMYMLGLMYYRGDVLPVDRIAALNLFEKSAVLGFKPALEQIEILSANDVPYALTTKGNIYRALKQLKYAADFYERAAKLGDAQGQFRFGEALEVGAGVDTNRERAKEYYQKSAAQNYDLARKALVRMEEKQ
jgi:TPR repeat protein